MSAAVVAATGSAPTPKPRAMRKRAARGDSSTDSDSDTCYHGGAAAEDMQPRARLSRACTLASTSIQPSPAEDEDSEEDSRTPAPLSAAELAASLPQRVIHNTDLAGQAGFDWC